MEITYPTIVERLSMRERQAGMHMMHQSWDKVLFMNWKIPVEVIRKKIPPPLHIDLFEDSAWITITPLDIFDVRPPFLPSPPYFGRFHELNVRTYVHLDGMPGVWFFSLDANSLLAVMGARLFFSLPYVNARISINEVGGDVIFQSHRCEEKRGMFTAVWGIGEPRSPAEPGSLEFFLVERYCLYTASDAEVYRCRIHHEPWPLQEPARLTAFESTMFEANGLPEPEEKPMLLCGGPVHVEVWGLDRV
jgi:uncharacterized protein YqjF (DUF2071 family)